MNNKAIPSNGRNSGEDYSRFHMKTYPVKEIGNIIFVWYGDREPAGEPDVYTDQLEHAAR